MKCKHGVTRHESRGRYRCPTARCSCCGNTFGYVNSMSGFVGPRQSEIRQWYPVGRVSLCGGCGGGYVGYCTWSVEAVGQFESEQR